MAKKTSTGSVTKTSTSSVTKTSTGSVPKTSTGSGIGTSTSSGIGTSTGSVTGSSTGSVTGSSTKAVTKKENVISLEHRKDALIKEGFVMQDKSLVLKDYNISYVDEELNALTDTRFIETIQATRRLMVGLASRVKAHNKIFDKVKKEKDRLDVLLANTIKKI